MKPVLPEKNTTKLPKRYMYSINVGNYPDCTSFNILR